MYCPSNCVRFDTLTRPSDSSIFWKRCGRGSNFSEEVPLSERLATVSPFLSYEEFPVLVASIALLTDIGYERRCFNLSIEMNLHGTLSSAFFNATVGILVFTTHANESDLNKS
jgi:hypothetical protein